MKTRSEERSIDYRDVISILGEEKIEQLHYMLGPASFSVAAVRNVLRKQKILSCLREGEPVHKIASRMGISRMTVYRELRKKIK